MHPTYHRCCWHVVCRCLFARLTQLDCSLAKGVYNPKAFIPHAALRRQTFVHCVRFPVAATRRCMGRVSVPFCPFPLSGRVPVIGLVSHYLTNYLMGDRLIHRRAVKRFSLARSCGISPSFDGVFHTIGEIPIHYSAVRN